MKQIFSLIIALASISFAIAQAPSKMSYQSVIRNSSGQLVTNGNVSIRISILQASANGNTVYMETHSKTTNANGLVSLEIGGGTVVVGTFSGVNWASGPYFLKTETDPAGGSNYSVVGTSQLLSVPYALYAASAGNVTPTYWTPTNNGIYYGSGSVGIGTSAISQYVPLTVYASNVNGNGNSVLHLKSPDTYHTAVSIFNGQGSSEKEYSFILAGPSNNTAVPGTFGLFNHLNLAWCYNINPATNYMAIGSSNGYYSNNPASRLHVFNGDVNIDQVGSGIIMKSPNGGCWRVNVSDSGTFVSKSIPCP